MVFDRHVQAVEPPSWYIMSPPFTSSEIAVDLLNELDTDIDLYGEERGDYKKFRKLLTKVFDQACAVPDNGLPPHSNLTDETIRGCIEGIGHFVDRVRNRIQGDYDLQLTLLELIEQIDHLDKTSTMAMFPHNLRNEKMRFRSLGMMGQAMLSLDDAVDKVASRNTKMLQ